MKRTGLSRRTPLSRTGWLPRRRQRGIPQPTRATVLDRDLFGCSYCGRGPTAIREAGLRLEIHHRLPRSRGGTDDIRNLVVVCGFGNAGGCHERMDTDRPEALRRGFVLHTGHDPASTPLVLWDGTVWLLCPDGTRRYVREAA